MRCSTQSSPVGADKQAQTIRREAERLWLSKARAIDRAGGWRGRLARAALHCASARCAATMLFPSAPLSPLSPPRLLSSLYAETYNHPKSISSAISALLFPSPEELLLY